MSSKAIHVKLIEYGRPFPLLLKLLKYNGPITLSKKTAFDEFSYLCKTIISQQLSSKAANTIWIRLNNCFRGEKLTPQAILNIDESALIFCGVSKYKMRAIKELANEFESNGSKLKTLFDSKDNKFIARHLETLWGIGPWTCDIFLLFFLNCPDVWPRNDISLQNCANKLFPELDYADFKLNVLSNFVPYRSYLAMHFWRGIDDNAV